MIEDKFLWGLKIADTLTMELTDRVTVIAMGVAAICFICSLSYNYLKHGTSQLLTANEDKFPDLMEIARCVALVFCLTLYTPIAKTIVGTFEVINEATSFTSDRANEFTQFVNRSTTEQSEMLSDIDKKALESGVQSGEDADGAQQKELDNILQENKVGGIESGIDNIVRMLNPMNLAATFIHGLAALLIGIIQIVILGIGVVIVKILVILGPFAFAFSILPVFEKQLSVWFGTLCSAGFVFTVINILNQIMWQTYKDIYSAGALDVVDEVAKPLLYLGLDLALIGSFCSVFWLSGKIVGHGDAGKIISKTMSIVTSAATAAVVGGAMAAGSAASSNVGAAASVGKSIINHDE